MFIITFADMSKPSHIQRELWKFVEREELSAIYPKFYELV